jgi:regulator of replication initiation timing
MRKNSTSFDGVENKYKDALKEIEGLIQENASMKSENRSLQEEKQQMAARLTAMESTKERELD